MSSHEKSIVSHPPSPSSSGDLPFLAGLNDSQLAAVEATEGPVLVLAGAGTGKTRVLTVRLASILAHGLARPWEVLAVTFTNKAAAEMRERVSSLAGAASNDIRLGTFHALGAWMLRQHAELAGLKSNFTILDKDDQIRLWKQIIEAAGIDEKKWPAKAIAAAVDRWKDRGLTPDSVRDDKAEGLADGRAVELYRLYQERLKILNAADFGDLLLQPLEIWRTHPDVLARFQARFRYILVDEYQDTNVAQYLWLRLLAQKHRNICCVGDDDQSIYGWRGAEVGNILRFETDFPGARIIRLERNYRSTSHILDVASSLIANNDSRLGKTLWTDIEDGERVKLACYWDGEDEARGVAEEIHTIQRNGIPLAEMAILVRAGFQTRDFEERFLREGVAYRVIGGLRFYERAVIRDALAYLRVVAEPNDDLAFERIINLPRRGIGKTTLQLLHRLARARGMSLTQAARAAIDTDELRKQARTNLRALLDDFERWRGRADNLPLAELAEVILDESGYTAMWQQDRSPDAPGKLENLRELIRALDEFESLEDFLEHVSLVMENARTQGDDMISLMTLHGAKGLEFDTVFLPGWEEGLFPHPRALEENGLKALEEERRLAYVGITRARRQCFISYATSRRMHGLTQPAIASRFVEELPPEHIERAATQLSAMGGLGGGFGSGFGADVEAEADPVTATYGPGYARMLAGRRRMTDVTPRHGQSARQAAPAAGIEPGVRVFHQKFGYGRVRTIDGDRLDVDFEKAGQKKVIATFVKPA